MRKITVGGRGVAFEFRTVAKIIFGVGVLDRLGEEAALLGRRAFLVLGRSFLKQTGTLRNVEEMLRQANLSYVIHDGVPPEPSVADAQQAVEHARSTGCDVVIGIGGGSALDIAKTVASIAPADGTVYDYFRGRQIQRKGLAFIAVPTTAGSGSEVTPNSVLTDETCGVKSSIRSNYMYADVALVDPELTLTVPRETTAYAGMDALSQAIEAYVSKGASPITDALAADASVRILRNLLGAYSDPQNISFRTEVALGSLMGGIAFANARLGLVHGLAHPLGVRTRLPHGLVCALLLPFALRFNTIVCEKKYANLARLAKITESESDAEAAEALVRRIEALNKELSIEVRRGELTVEASEWDSIVEESMASGSTKSNPREVTPGDIKEVLSLLG